MSFAPIAVVGRACVLPGALNPGELWSLVAEGRDVIAPAPAERWGLAAERVLSDTDALPGDRACSDRGGYVRGFDRVFDPGGFDLPVDEINALDPLFQWVLHTARQALRDAGHRGSNEKVGAVFGNLSFPSASLSRFAESVWLDECADLGSEAARAIGRHAPDPRNRFSSGLPALLLERALGLGAGSFALDAACASSLYAIKVACGWLHDGRADVALAGAVNCTDDLFIHVGFTALGALSPSGRSRPFHAKADGLVPAEGAGFVALKRLDDAVRDGDHIHAVLRGVGLSNDGRGKGFLVPSSEGQVRAMRSAYELAEIDPSDISLLECHATGTTIGDATEVESLVEVFSQGDGEAVPARPPVPLGSLKSNMGHLITAAGVAGLIKVMEAMRAGVRPPTLHADELVPALEDAPFRVLTDAEPWEVSGGDGVRRAGISAFGFGGNNAHLIVEEYRPADATEDEPASTRSRAVEQETATVAGTTAGSRPDDGRARVEPIAIVGMGVIAAGCDGRDPFADALLSGRSCLREGEDGRPEGRGGEIEIDAAALAIPPSDLRQCLAQQLWMLEAASEAVAEVDPLPRERTGVFVGMGVDAEIARYGARWRVGEWAERWQQSNGDATAPDPSWLAEARAEITDELRSAGVIGTMPNIVANRINRLFDLGGPSFSIAAEERSGPAGLDFAMRALGAGELDAAVVGAVDLSCEPVHRKAAQALLPAARHTPGDAAIAMVLKRLGDAERDGDRIYALIEEPPAAIAATLRETRDGEERAEQSRRAGHERDRRAGDNPPEQPADERHESDLQIESRFGHAHAASGLIELGAAALALHHRRRPSGKPWVSSKRRRSDTTVRAMDGLRDEHWTLVEATGALARSIGPVPRLHLYAGENAGDVLAALTAGRESDHRLCQAPARLVVVAADEDELAARTERAHAHVRDGAPAGRGVYFRSAPVSGDMAFVFTSAAAAYAGMGAELLCALPELGDRVGARFAGLTDATDWVYSDGDVAPTGTERLWGASVLSQAHAELSLGLLGLRPQAAIGYSSGESNALFALGAWTDMDSMREEIETSAMYERELGGTFDAVARVWGEPVRWAVWSIFAPIEEVRAALVSEPRVHLAIVHTARDCVIAGEAAACERIAGMFSAARTRKLDYNLAAHVPEVDAFRDQWLAIHRRKVTPVDDVRFYTGADNRAYRAESEACARAILGQACHTLDFSKTIEQAWADGVRVFVEHGPQAACSGWIREVLGDRAQSVVITALDRSGHGFEQIFDAAAALLTAGVAVDTTALAERFAAPAAKTDSAAVGDTAAGDTAAGDTAAGNTAARDVTAGRTTARKPMALMTVAPHPQAVRLSRPPRRDASDDRLELPALNEETSDPGELQIMQPAPALPPVLYDMNESTGATTVGADAGGAGPVAAVATGAVLPGSAPTGAVPMDFSPTDAAMTVSPAPAGAVAPVSPALAPDEPSAGADTTALTLWREQMEELNRVHQEFVTHQTEAHARFLALQAQTWTRAAGETAGVPAQSASVAPVAPSAIATPMPQGIPVAQVPPKANGTAKAIAPTSVGPTFDRKQLEVHASGRISEIFGERFEQQDDYARQVRMPEPPLLLADRVTGLDAEPGSMGKGTIWTETDVRHDSWYMNEGRMPAGITIESGQADLMLISYLGADFINRSDRVYRLLGCNLTYHGDLPEPGETLCYEIHVDGHARQDDVRLFFFHYDCRVNGELRLRVTGGQAGFFTDEELADSAGILWTPEEADIVETPRLEPPDAVCTKSRFDRDDVRAFADGRAFDCFGPGFELAQTHTRSPSIQDGRMLFLDEVSELDPSGGPWKRGYLKAEAAIDEHDWFFDGHFKNDPCMPGTLMFEGCVQTMSFYLAAMGFTLRRDGWRFQPVAGEPMEMRCRGQATPESKRLIYEVFVEEIVAGPEPTVIADLLCTVDGRKAFHARRVGLRLVPDWPLSSRPELTTSYREPKPVAVVPTASGDFAFGYQSLLACAWGKPSDAFGDIYAAFDGPRRIPRLPGPPYHFMSRVLRVDGELGVPESGISAEFEYDVPSDAWYFDHNGVRTMPFCVVMEAALQPCGWLASFIGSALTSEDEMSFRNLDGTGTFTGELHDDAGTLGTTVKLVNISRSAGMIIVSFEVECFLGDRRVYDMKTVFGFFPAEALANQVGLPTAEEQTAELNEPCTFSIDLRDRPADYFEGTLRLPEPMLLMLDRVSGYWPEGGRAGLGRLRAEKDVDAGEWFFKAHFFQDPVQPGSLGIEAMIQLLQFYMLECNLHEGMNEPRFEALAIDAPLTWKYRGQVVPSNGVIHTTLDVVEVGKDERGPYAVAEASLWVDGRRIYEAKNLGMRIVSGQPRGRLPAGATETLDPAVDVWLGDHRPTYNRPALPMMSMVDRLAAAVPGRVVAMRDVQVKRWVDFDGARTLRTEVEPVPETDAAGHSRREYFVRLWAGTHSDEPNSQAEVEVATARVSTGAYSAAPAALEPVEGEPIGDPYERGVLFHGPAFQVMDSGTVSAGGASTRVRATTGDVPTGLLNPALLDGALHGIPHDGLHLWCPDIPEDRVCYPARIERLELFGPTPVDGMVRVEVRFDGFFAKPDFPALRIQLIGEGGVWAELRLVEACFRKGRLGAAEPRARRAFLRDKQFEPAVALCRRDDGETRLRAEEVEAVDWMPGTIESVYGSTDVETIATKEHLAAREEIHPRFLPEALPFSPPRIEVSRDGEDFVVRDAPADHAPGALLDVSLLQSFWNSSLGMPERWAGSDLWEGLVQRYVRRLHVLDPPSLAALKGRGAIFVGNHQVQIESLLITSILGALTGTPVVTMSNAKQETRWIGWLLRHLFSYPGCRDPRSIVYFDQSKPESMFGILDALKPEIGAGRRSFFVHPQGTRGRSCRERVTAISSLFLDMALELEVPIVPVRFSGGLPVDRIETKLEFPFEHGKQDYTVGRAIEPEELGALAYGERRVCVLDAINGLGAPIATERPWPGDPDFATRVAEWSARTGAYEVEAAFFRILEDIAAPSSETEALLEGARTGELVVTNDEQGRWLAALAERVYGPSGPTVRIEG